MNEQGCSTRVDPSRRRPAALAGLVLVLAFSGGAQAADAPATPNQLPQTPLFSRHIVPILARLGCNAGGSCHGTVKGQGGFRLSLFGGQPAVDFERLTREYSGRRLNFNDPDRSLILLKATGQVPHGGGKRTTVASTDYLALRAWIAAGSPLDDATRSRVTRLVVNPAEQILKVGESHRLQVTATYADGSSADVTNLCRHETRDEEVATIDLSGTVRGRQVGDTAAVIRYGAEPVLASLLVVPAAASTKPFPAITAHNFIDEHILAKLRAMDVPPAALCDDATFLRRLYLDVIGYLPPPEEARAFLADKTADKRNKKIDEVLAKPGHAEIWAAQFSDLIKPVERGNEGSNNLVGGQVLRIRFYEWLRARLQENVPYDQLVERIFVSSSLEGRPVAGWIAEFEALRDEPGKKKDRPLSEPLLSVYNQRRTLDLYWERDGATGVSGAMQFAHAFLGLRLQCAQCHRHPYDVWQQDDLLSFANFFTAMNTAPGHRKNSPEVEAHANRLKPELKAWTDEVKKLSASKTPADQAKVAQLQGKIASAQALLAAEVAPLSSGVVGAVSVQSPLGTQESKVARLLGEKTIAAPAAGQDRRKMVIDWLRRPDNPFFARAVVNRVWAHYLGRGLIDPPDNLSPLNPPSHARLLDALAQGFIKNHYDLRWLHRTILQSRTYQQSQEGGPARNRDRRSYARFQIRRLPGEVILDVVNQATGAREKYPAGWMFREGERAVLTAGVMVDVYNFYNINDPFRYLVFGRQLRRTNVQCDCEQGNDVALPQLLFLANHEEVRRKIAADNGRVAQLAGNARLDNQQRLEELFLAALARLPNAEEVKAGLEHLKTSDTLRKGLEEVLWSLINTREFQLNY
jgi:Protein of unknown function (DUF1553)/Protein of unknown function (DUF1549)/Bacterial Ig-like domain (group 2)